MRIIAHLDMDAFFASVEEADSPHFKGLPIVVGSDPAQGMGRGVVSTANYAARKYGIKSAVPISKAWLMSKKAEAEGKPEAIFLPVNFERYREVSEEIFKIIKKYSDLVEPASIDEFYFSAEGGPASGWDYAVKLCKKIKKEIKENLNLTCSVGIGCNKLISKISAGIEKPDGLTVVKEKDVEKFLDPLPIREIPGIGPKTEQILMAKGIEKIKDLKKFSDQELHDLLGKWGSDLFLKARGIDDSLIIENREAKSIGEQSTLSYNTLNAAEIGEVFESLCKSVFLRFKQSGFEGFKTISVVVRFSNFETKTSAKTLKNKTSGQKDFKLAALRLLLPYLDKRKNPKRKSIRLVGVKISGLSAKEKHTEKLF